jgi:phosphatidylinositol alpha-1,6-mannosyltransferase
MLPRVLFVSKPIAPPFHDGTKCLVRDVAGALTRFEPHVMSTPSGAALPSPVQAHPVYRSSGRFSPDLGANARAAAWLALRARADVWHYVFAPNARTSGAGRLLKALRRVPVVQTVASPPRSFNEAWFFGDVVVAQSEWTRQRIEAALGRAGRESVHLEVIPPPVPTLQQPDSKRLRGARQALGIDADAALFVYPGDLETSSGAETVARVVSELIRRVPGAVVVFAYRAKTPRAAHIAADLRRRLPNHAVRVAGEVTDFLALVAGATAVLFPVDDLYGKVDLPIALLESMQLRVPVVCLDAGPLRELAGAVKLRGDIERSLIEQCESLARDHSRAAEIVEAAHGAVIRRHAPATVARAYEALYTRALVL